MRSPHNPREMEVDAAEWPERLISAWARLTLGSIKIGEAACAGDWFDAVELRSTTPLFAPLPTPSRLFDREPSREWLHLAYQPVAETHQRDDNLGWHIHLTSTKNGGRQRLGYRLLFDSNTNQNCLAWETHGKGPTELGDPAICWVKDPEPIWDASVLCVHNARRLAPKGNKFSAWAARFAPTSSKSYALRLGRNELEALGTTRRPIKWQQVVKVAR